MERNLLIRLKNLLQKIKTASKRATHKTAEATGDLVGNKITNKIKILSKKSTKMQN